MIKKRIIYWLAGAAVAFGGVFMVRILSHNSPDNGRIMITLMGYSLAFLGLFIITLGTKRKG